ncbi:MAG: hypothetical protein JW991_00460 [Candidatus Pacebacteria bacterium]|nr:hypothetical protein [Candidatus Paceibacterota bacterium]
MIEQHSGSSAVPAGSEAEGESGEELRKRVIQVLERIGWQGPEPLSVHLPQWKITEEGRTDLAGTGFWPLPAFMVCPEGVRPEDLPDLGVDVWDEGHACNIQSPLFRRGERELPFFFLDSLGWAVSLPDRPPESITGLGIDGRKCLGIFIRPIFEEGAYQVVQETIVLPENWLVVIGEKGLVLSQVEKSVEERGGPSSELPSGLALSKSGQPSGTLEGRICCQTKYGLCLNDEAQARFEAFETALGKGPLDLTEALWRKFGLFPAGSGNLLTRSGRSPRKASLKWSGTERPVRLEVGRDFFRATVMGLFLPQINVSGEGIHFSPGLSGDQRVRFVIEASEAGLKASLSLFDSLTGRYYYGKKIKEELWRGEAVVLCLLACLEEPPEGEAPMFDDGFEREDQHFPGSDSKKPSNRGKGAYRKRSGSGGLGGIGSGTGSVPGAGGKTKYSSRWERIRSRGNQAARAKERKKKRKKSKR